MKSVLTLVISFFLLSGCAKLYLKMSGGRDLMTPVTSKELEKYAIKMPLGKDDLMYVVEDSVWLRLQNLQALTSKLYDKTGNCLKTKKGVIAQSDKKTCSAPFYLNIINYNKDAVPTYLLETILDEAKKWQNVDYTEVDNVRLLQKVAQYDVTLIEYFWVNKGKLDRKGMREINDWVSEKRKDLKVLYIKVCVDRQAKWNLSEEQLVESWKKDTTGLKVKVKKKK